MSKQEKIYDLAIIGAGITGVGISLAASQHKLETILIEGAEQVAKQASNNSLRIIHGGFRYLQSMNIFRTLKSLKAQKELLLTYPDLIVALRCIMPLGAKGLKSKYPAIIGARLYELFQLFLKSPLPKPLVESEPYASVFLPFLSKRFNNSALIWHDAQMLNPEELVSRELALTKGTVQVLTATKVTSIINHSDYFELKVMDGQIIKARKVVNAAASGIQKIRKENISNFTQPVYWGKSFNLIFKDHRFLKSAFAVSSNEGRQYFVVPRENNQIALGTFTAGFEQEITEELQLQALSSFNLVCPEFALEAKNLVDLELGILPARREFKNDADFLSSDLILQADKYFEVYVAKYTTYRQFGRRVIKQVLRS